MNPASDHDRLVCLLRAGLLTGVVDGLFSSVLSVAAYGSTVTRLFQGVASVLMGSEAFNGGIRTALLGVAMHFGVAVGVPIAAVSGRGSAPVTERP